MFPLFLQFLQQQQQPPQQISKLKGEQSLQSFSAIGGVHGVTGGDNLPASSGATLMSQPPKNISDLCHQHDAQTRDESQSLNHQACLNQNDQQQGSQMNLPVQQQHKFHMTRPPGRCEDTRISNIKMQDDEHVGRGERQMELGQTSTDQRNIPNPPSTAMGQVPSPSMIKPVQSLQSQADANCIPQVLPFWQSSSKLDRIQKPNEASTSEQRSYLPSSKQHVTMSPVSCETSTHGNSFSHLSGESGGMKGPQILSSGAISSGTPMTPITTVISNDTRFSSPLPANGNGGLAIHLPQSSGSLSQSIHYSNGKNRIMQMQNPRQMHQLNHQTSQSEVPRTPVQSQDPRAQVPQQRIGFTNLQFRHLKAQLLALKHIKRGEALPPEILQAIAPPPVDSQPQQVSLAPGMGNHEKAVVKNVEEYTRHVESNDELCRHLQVVSTSGQGSHLPSSKEHVTSSPVVSERSTHGNSLSHLSGHVGLVKGPQICPSWSGSSGEPNTTLHSNKTGPTGAVQGPQIHSSGTISTGSPNTPNATLNLNNTQLQQLSCQSSQYQDKGFGSPLLANGNSGSAIHLPQSSGNSSHNIHYSNVCTSEVPGGPIQAQSGSAQVPQQRIGFTEQQFCVLRAQLMAFRNLRRGEGILSPQILQAIAPPPLDSQPQQVYSRPGIGNQEKAVVKNVEEYTRHVEANGKAPQSALSSNVLALQKDSPSTGEETTIMVNHKPQAKASMKEPSSAASASKLKQNREVSVKPKQVSRTPGMGKQKKAAVENVEEYNRHMEANDKAPQFALSCNASVLPKNNLSTGEEATVMVNREPQAKASMKEPATAASASKLKQNRKVSVKFKQVSRTPRMGKQKKAAVENLEEYNRHMETNDVAPQPSLSSNVSLLPKDNLSTGVETTVMVNQEPQAIEEPTWTASALLFEQNREASVKPKQVLERESLSMYSDAVVDKENAILENDTTLDAGQAKKPSPISDSPLFNETVALRKCHGPLFKEQHDSLGSTILCDANRTPLAYDAKDLLFEEGQVVLKKRRTENFEKLSSFLAVNLERKMIRSDLVLKLEIERKKLLLLDRQTRLRDEVYREQMEIMKMSDRLYPKFVSQCECQRNELLRQVRHPQRASRVKQIKPIFQWRKKFFDAHLAMRDARIARNKGVTKYHERMLREFSKRSRNKRIEALKNNNVDKYREMLQEQQTKESGDAAQRYAVLSSFLSQTEEYIQKLGCKITAAKNHEVMEEAANTAAAAARSQGLSEEEISAAADCAGEEVINRFSEMYASKESSFAIKYYNLAHAVNEIVVGQPSMLSAGTLRDYQLVGLQWMLSLYNNKLNGILADEMGLGKTVQVMALIAYLMEFKGNNGPHLIIVPNAVVVNWKSELHNWLPSLKCIFYVGGKNRRSNLFSNDVCAMSFNVLVTTYEFVMNDRSKLSKISWKYMIIDEAQRMKDRESVLARDLDRFHCQRRLLLTGTPLQNDLKELWSLLNLLLPEVFDNQKSFHDWFSKPFQKGGSSKNGDDEDWLETEKKVIIIHRLHQILEPFMLRRRVKDVEGSLPPKVSIVLRCRMSAIQGAIYDWVKFTGTIRVDPEDELRRVEKNPNHEARISVHLNNKCMELRKACNHPLLNYPCFTNYSKDFIVRSCGKLWMLDRILMKLQRSGHRVLLFSTMTKLLDILEEYLQWRSLGYRRIDGSTSLENRESAIDDFNRLNSDCFIFLLSIRAAGRGLNLQSADTVVIYDPDPNPQNEEQAVARAHRIGQKKEVRVIYLEAVVDEVSSLKEEDDFRNGAGDPEDDPTGKGRYKGSIESLVRNKIQQYKLEMADEVINAGRFDQRTTHEERRMTLEALLHDDERNQETVYDVPSLHEVNRMIARSEEEVKLFDQMDDEFDWTEEMVRHNQVPKWLRAGSKELNDVISPSSNRPSNNIVTDNTDLESRELASGSYDKTERRRSQRRRVSRGITYFNMEFDDEDCEDSGSSSTHSLYEGDEEIEEVEGGKCKKNIEVVRVRQQKTKRKGSVCIRPASIAGLESRQEQESPECLRQLHPGNLIICKKRKNDGDCAAAKKTEASSSQAAPVPPAGASDHSRHKVEKSGWSYQTMPQKAGGSQAGEEAEAEAEAQRAMRLRSSYR